MVVDTKLTISGVTIIDAENINVIKSMSENNASSHFSCSIDNFFGRHKTQFVVGNTVEIFADIDTVPPKTKLFSGILEDVKFAGKPDNEKVTLSGRDFTARLMDRTIEPEVYSNLNAGSIVKDIIAKYTDDITTTNVTEPAGSIARITFNHPRVFDGVKQLADLAPNFIHFVDVDKDLHFNEKSTVSSKLTFDSGNTISTTFTEKRDSIFNEVWVYGDRYLDNFQETFTAGSPLGGSVFTLINKPHNTEVTAGGLRQVGEIFRQSIVPASGPDFVIDYLINFEDRQIIFISGTDLGYSSIPASGVEVIIKYDRSLPVVKVGTNEDSIAQFGKRVKTIIDKNIKDPSTAELIVSRTLVEDAFPKKEGSLNMKGILNVTPSETAIVNFPNEGVNNKTFDIIEANYTFTKQNNLSERVLKIKVNKKLTDLTDTIKDILEQLKKLQASDIDNADVITRMFFTAGSIGIRQSGLVLSIRNPNDSFLLGTTQRGVLGITGSPNTGSILGNQFFVSGFVNFGFNKALNFAGSPDLVVVPDNDSIEVGADDFSISCWIKTGSQGNMGILGKLFTTLGAVGYNLKINGLEKAIFTIANASLPTTVTSAGSVNTGVAVHIAATADRNGFAKIYIDGIIAGSTDISSLAGNISNGAPFVMGVRQASFGGLADYYAGDIDDVRLYNKLLTANEIGSLAAGVNYPTGSLLAYWKLDENVGSFVYSSVSGTGHFVQGLLGDRADQYSIFFSGGYP